MTDFQNFKGAAKRLDDIDIPRIGHRIRVGEDEVHAFMDTETTGKGFDAQDRPRMLFEPHRFYANLKGDQRAAAVKAALAYKDWKPGAYPRDSYPRLKKAMAINESAALKSASWGLGQVMGENHKMAGYETVQAMVLAMMADEENHLEAMINFIIAAGIDDEMRKLAALDRPTTAEDCVAIVEVYNGKGFRKNNYHVKFAAAHNKWRKIKDTAWSPDAPIVVAPIAAPTPVTKPNDKLQVIASVQQLLRDKGYPEVGEPDNVFGTRTRNAILAFQADNGLPLTGEISDGLLAELIKAPKREMAASRENATAKDLKEQGNTTVQNADWLQKIGAGLLVSMGLGGLGDGIVNFDSIKKGIGDVRSLAEALGTFGPWVLGLGVGAAALYFGRKVITEQVKAFREGRSV